MKMAMTDVKEFIEAVDADQELQHKMRLAGERYQGDPEDIDRIIKENVLPFARELGLHFTEEEYMQFLDGDKSSAKLDEDDLDMVVGGQGDTYFFNIVVVYLPGVSPKQI